MLACFQGKRGFFKSPCNPDSTGIWHRDDLVIFQTVTSTRLVNGAQNSYIVPTLTWLPCTAGDGSTVGDGSTAGDGSRVYGCYYIYLRALCAPTLLLTRTLLQPAIVVAAVVICSVGGAASTNV